MFYYLAQFSDQFAVLNVFRYLTFRAGGSVLTAMLVAFIFGPAIIRWLKNKQGRGQPIRSDGPQSHLLTKQGTPTMGGVMILLGIGVSTLLWADLSNSYVWIALIVTMSFGLIGFIDDYLKLTKRSSGGLPGRVKLIGEVVISVVASYFIIDASSPELAKTLAVPLFKNMLIGLGVFYVPFAAFIMVGTSNAVNLTDGLDGLAIVPVMIAAAVFTLIAYVTGNSVFANYLQIHYVVGAGELAVFCAGVIGAGLGFLWFNAPPAMVFMG
ncbi:MAG: phospho-N-acetylmuramoyl-pentapeptide-transferase, partial [Rhodobacteraceae bacterium]|nr:phospho-N-acetylmuramoyl-pentapeptide-transferase [Paracoccaceae bacterium]